MYKNPYEIIRETIRESIDYLKHPNIDPKQWNKARRTMNEVVETKLSQLRKENPSNSKIKDSYYSEFFRSIFIERNNNRVYDLIYNSNLTKKETLQNLFLKPDEERKDFDPKTKDFFAVYCGYNGWLDLVAKTNFTREKKTESIPSENLPTDIDKDQKEFDKFIELIKTFELRKLKESSDLGSTVLERLRIKEEVQKLINKLDQLDDFLESIIPSIANEEIIARLFEELSSAKKLQTTQIKAVEAIIRPDNRRGWEWYHSSLIASALTISIINEFEVKKADLLLEIYSS